MLIRIPILEMPGFEADDVIGTLATQLENKGIKTYDDSYKDYGQLVGRKCVHVSTEVRKYR